MTNGTLCVHWTHDFQDSELATDVFHAFFGGNWLSIFFKNNTYSEKNSLNKYMLKIKVSKQEKHQNDVTDVVRISLLLTLNTFPTLS